MLQILLSQLGVDPEKIQEDLQIFKQDVLKMKNKVDTFEQRLTSIENKIDCILAMMANNQTAKD